MSYLRLLVVGLVAAVLVGSSHVLADGVTTDAPTRLVEVRSGDMERNLAAFRAAQRDGHLKLAGRADGVAFFYVGPEGSGLLRAGGIEHSLLVEDVTGSDIYLITRSGAEDRAAIAESGRIISEGDSYYLVQVDPAAAFTVHLLPFKKLLPPTSEAGLPLWVEPAPAEKPSQKPLSYDPTIQAMVDQVSTSSLYSWLNDLTGENTVTIGGETYTIYTRYSPTVMCRRSGQFIKEQFEAMGLEAEYDYFNFRTVLKAVVFPFDDLEGWAVGRRKTVIHTQDGGDLWVEDSWDAEAVLNDIAMWSRTHGCVVGNEGFVIITEDGRTWQTVSPPTSNDLSAVVFIDSATVFCCGADGTILRSTDGGDAWSSISSPTSRDLKGMCFASATEGWAVGTSGRIIRTQNGGSTWSIVSSPVSADLNGVVFKGTEKGWICGSGGTMLKTEDGATWEEVSTPVSADLTSVFFFTDIAGWACGLDGAIIRTWDGGSTWIDVSLPSMTDLSDICFATGDVGWIVGGGTVQQSLNSGIDWENKNHAVESGDVNVEATIPGVLRPEEIYIICGHYDCISQIPETYAPGADDNGTGTVATLEAARVLKDYDFEATLRFVCFSREEQGLVGSGQYVKQAYEGGDSIVGALNFDMIGYEDIDPEDVNILYNSISLWLANEYESAVGLYVPDLGVVKRYMSYVGSDNSSFWDYGYSSFCGIEDMPLNNPQYHRTTDRVSTVDFDFYTDVVKGAVATLADLAVLDTGAGSIAQVTEPGRFRVSPNPGRGEITVEMPLEGKLPEYLGIYDISGRLVARIRPSVTGTVARGVWRGLDDSGRPVSPGIYCLKATVAGEGAAKIVLLK